jgi:hypothetical protein
LKTLFVAILGLKIVLAHLKALIGTTIRVAVYALHNILIEELVDVNTICGAVMVSVIMEKIVLVVLLIVVDVLPVEMDFALIKVVRIVQLAFKIVVLVLFLYVVMVTVIFTSTKIV